MKTLCSTLALTALLTSAALAEPALLTAAQLDAVTAGAGSGIAGGGECRTVYGGGAGVDPSVYAGNGNINDGGEFVTAIVVPSDY